MNQAIIRCRQWTQQYAAIQYLWNRPRVTNNIQKSNSPLRNTTDFYYNFVGPLRQTHDHHHHHHHRPHYRHQRIISAVDTALFTYHSCEMLTRANKILFEIESTSRATREIKYFEGNT